MFLATKNGMCFAMPDALKVPIPAPPGFVVIPFPNFAQLATATGHATKVMANSLPALHLGCEVPKTQGGEPGTQKGLQAPFQLEKMQYKQPASKVMIEGKPAVCFLKVTAHNGITANAPAGNHIVPSQALVIIQS